MIISSRSNTGIKAIRALRSRKERERTGLFLVEGLRAVGEAVQMLAGVQTLVVAPDLLTSQFGRELVSTCEHNSVTVLRVTPEVFQSIALKENPQGIIAVVTQRWESLAEVAPGGGLCWVALDAVADPGNLGTILRTSDAVGGSGVILLGETTDPHDPAAVRASTGAIFSQRLVRTGIEELVAWKRRHGCTVAGASGGGTIEYTEVEYRPPVVLLMGSERHGLSKDHQDICDVVVRIPMSGRSDSLNLAVATGVVLYEMLRQRRAVT